MRKLLSAGSDALRAKGLPMLKQLEWADDTERSATRVAQDMAEGVEDYRACATAFASRPDEEARTIVAALLGLAA